MWEKKTESLVKSGKDTDGSKCISVIEMFEKNKSNNCETNWKLELGLHLDRDVVYTTTLPLLAWQRINPLECKGNYGARLNNINLVQWPLMGGLLHLVQRGETGWGRSSPSPLFAVPNVAAHPSTATVPVTVLLYNGPLLCGVMCPLKG